MASAGGAREVLVGGGSRILGRRGSGGCPQIDRICALCRVCRHSGSHFSPAARACLWDVIDARPHDPCTRVSVLERIATPRSQLPGGVMQCCRPYSNSPCRAITGSRTNAGSRTTQSRTHDGSTRPREARSSPYTPTRRARFRSESSLSSLRHRKAGVYPGFAVGTRRCRPL